MSRTLTIGSFTYASYNKIDISIGIVLVIPHPNQNSECTKELY